MTNARLFSLASAVTIALVTTARAAEGYGRIDIGEAHESMVEIACGRVYPSDETQRATCKAAHFDERSHDNKHLWEQGGAGDKECLLAGGVLTAKMPACVDAMVEAMVTERDENVTGMYEALGAVVERCGSRQLCLDIP